jgi:hypothetical protein
MHIPKTDLHWTTSVQAKKYADALTEVQKRPIVAWFSADKRCVHQLYKVTARLGDNCWMVMGHNYDEETEVAVTINPTELRKALRYLTKENGWTMCEFASGRDFHQAVLDYLS